MSSTAGTAFGLFTAIGFVALLATFVVAGASPLFIHDPGEALLFKKSSSSHGHHRRGRLSVQGFQRHSGLFSQV